MLVTVFQPLSIIAAYIYSKKKILPMLSNYEYGGKNRYQLRCLALKNIAILKKGG